MIMFPQDTALWVQILVFSFLLLFWLQNMLSSAHLTGENTQQALEPEYSICFIPPFISMPLNTKVCLQFNVTSFHQQLSFSKASLSTRHHQLPLQLLYQLQIHPQRYNSCVNS